MKFEQYVKEYKKEMERLGIDETDITDGELMKMFLSHSVIRNWDNEQQKKEKMKKILEERRRRRERDE